MHDLNVIIVNWKTKNDVDRCLSSLQKELDLDLRTIVQVVDNSQNCDQVKELIKDKYPWVRYIDPGRNIGFGKAQNIGINNQEAKFYLPLNPDVEFIESEKTIRESIKILKENKRIGIIGPKILNNDESIQLSCYRFFSFLDPIARRLNWKSFQDRVDHYLMRDFTHQESTPVDWIMGSFMLIKKEVLDEIGLFDDRFFMYFEDTDICRRAWSKDWEVWYIHNLKIKHTHHRDSAKRSSLTSIISNPITRIHIKSWFKYFLKWGFKKEHFGK